MTKRKRNGGPHKNQISLSGPVYAKLKAYAAKVNLAISTVVEMAVAPDLNHEPPPPKPARRYRGPRT